MSRAGALADRILRRHPHDADERSVIDDIAGLPEETNPYPADGVQAAQAETVSRAKLGPVLHLKPAAETRPMPVLAGNAPVPPVPDGTQAVSAVAVDMPDLALLTRVRDGMERKWRVESFAADREELPFFKAVTRQCGWAGLHMQHRGEFRHQRWTTERWMAGAMAAVAQQTDAARCAVYDEISQARARVFAPAGGAR